METKKIIIEVDDEGNIQIEANGFTGKNCLESTKFIEDLLGEPKERKLKPEYYIKEKETVKKHLKA